MSRRVVAVAAPAGPLTPLALAMLEDVVDLVEQMQHVEAALAVGADVDDTVYGVTWPGMPVLEVSDVTRVAEVLDAVSAIGVDEAAVVCAEVPDLPALLLAKLHSALTGADVAACPADDGGLIAVACASGPPDWLRSIDPRLDEADALARLRAAAPPRSLVVGPGWHRIRSAGDVHLLDTGLEGWEATRAVLGVGGGVST